MFKPAVAERRDRRKSVFTWLQLFIVAGLAVVVFFLLAPFHEVVSKRSRSTVALSHAKQIALALRLYASDNCGDYPSYYIDKKGHTLGALVTNSNDAFSELLPTYIQDKSVFWLSDSAFCTASPDALADNRPLDKGENEWAYVRDLNDSSNPAVPLIASGFASSVSHTYSRDQTERGGTWKGQVAIVIRADTSGSIMKVNPEALIIKGSNGGSSMGDIFSTSNADAGWLDPKNVVVNPK